MNIGCTIVSKNEIKSKNGKKENMKGGWMMREGRTTKRRHSTAGRDAGQDKDKDKRLILKSIA